MTQSQATTALAPVPVPVPVPLAPQVRELLQTLTGCDVEIGAGRPVVAGREPALVAVHVTDELATGAVIAYGPLPDEVARTLGYLMRRIDLQVEVAGYGGGRLSVVSVA